LPKTLKTIAVIGPNASDVEVLLGDYNPGGRLPVTFYRSAADLPPFKDYQMKGHTYRYFEGEPLDPFGFGLSYTKFEYSNLVLPKIMARNEEVTVAVDVQNAGARAWEEVVQLYLTDLEASVPVPLRSLQGFERVSLRANPPWNPLERFPAASHGESLVK